MYNIRCFLLTLSSIRALQRCCDISYNVPTRRQWFSECHSVWSTCRRRAEGLASIPSTSTRRQWSTARPWWRGTYVGLHHDELLLLVTLPSVNSAHHHRSTSPWIISQHSNHHSVLTLTTGPAGQTDWSDWVERDNLSRTTLAGSCYLLLR